MLCSLCTQLYGFSSAKKMASVLIQLPDKLRLYNKGAAEWVLKRCIRCHTEVRAHAGLMAGLIGVVSRQSVRQVAGPLARKARGCAA